MILVDYKLKMGQGYDLIPQNARTGLDCDNRKEEVETPVNTRVFFCFFFLKDKQRKRKMKQQSKGVRLN